MTTTCFISRIAADRFVKNLNCELSVCEVEKLADLSGSAFAMNVFSSASGQCQCYRDVKSRNVVAVWWSEETEAEGLFESFYGPVRFNAIFDESGVTVSVLNEEDADFIDEIKGYVNE